MENLTQQQKESIAMEMFNDYPLTTICHLALLKMVEMSINLGGSESEIGTLATFNGKQYECKMIINFNEVV